MTTAPPVTAALLALPALPGIPTALPPAGAALSETKSGLDAEAGRRARVAARARVMPPGVDGEAAAAAPAGASLMVDDDDGDDDDEEDDEEDGEAVAAASAEEQGGGGGGEAEAAGADGASRTAALAPVSIYQFII